MINVNDYPQLRVLLWSREYKTQISDEDAFALYCQHQNHIDQDSLTVEEEALIVRLFEKYGG